MRISGSSSVDSERLLTRWRVNGQTGVTLLEILVAMVVLGLVATGLMGSFMNIRQVAWRSATELSAAQFAQVLAEELRLAVGGPSPTGLTLAPGIYVDENMLDPPPGAIPIAGLNLPPQLQRFQMSPGDGWLMVVERADDGNPATTEDLDGDGQIGYDFNGDFETDLHRIQIRVQWTSLQGG